MKKSVPLASSVSVPIGINGTKQNKFDLGSEEPLILVECKSHTWTETGNMPSAKMKDWNEAMYLFYATPGEYRKLFVVLRDNNAKRRETLAQYYIRTNSHFIPSDVRDLGV